ncbi:MAG: PAS domain S-box protein [Candidatus Coatesbacteria bacterium]|nr:MAG: PAS domain S-box protein [Candidatus Coatesbacteria bacterium]
MKREKTEYDKFKTIFDSTIDAMFIYDMDGNFIEVNRTACERLGYTYEEFLSMKLSKIYAPEFYNALLLKIDELKKRGNTLFETVMISKDGRKIPMEVNSQIINFGGKKTILSIARDITERKLAEESLWQSFKTLKKSLESIITIMNKIMGTRDPYTALHQKRVAKLATAIAEEMNLPEEQLEGTRLSASIHDIGKIYLPAEILSKPSKLNHLELNLIQSHPWVGYDILKSIEFPWPIAEIVLQHHERMDGSGYPQGLEGDDILVEARILGVADVVEAMTSHRPYRPAHSIETALNEIDKNKGILYDTKIVDICIHLFTENVFNFEGNNNLSHS